MCPHFSAHSLRPLSATTDPIPTQPHHWAKSPDVEPIGSATHGGLAVSKSWCIQRRLAAGHPRGESLRDCMTLEESELTPDGFSDAEAKVRPFCAGAACGSLFPSMSLQEVAPHTPGNSNEAESRRIVINQRTLHAWAEFTERHY